ncbi:UNVERIFIED_CONTAM: protein SRG1 [Sesamum calycinum]|uniref:Protein SRG1 n=1 Tax=Sesamum calycinum TaxID=2727403 RepID=A0AAW2JTW4_9LAMI
MGVERDVLKQLHGEVKQGTRMNYYPVCARPDLVFALSPHCDYTSISFVLQDDDITALQIKHKGMWVPVKPIPNAISVLVGDVMEIAAAIAEEAGAALLTSGRRPPLQRRATTCIALHLWVTLVPESELAVAQIRGVIAPCA